MNRIILSLIVYLAFCFALSAQVKKLNKAESLYESGKYLKSLKLLEKSVIEHDETKNLPQPYLLAAKCIITHTDNPANLSDFEDPELEALKYAKKALSKDKENSLLKSEMAFLQLLESRVLEIGNNQLSAGKTNKALKYFTLLSEISNSVAANYALANTFLYQEDTVITMQILHKVLQNTLNKQMADSKNTEPFAVYLNYLMRHKHYDSVLHYAEPLTAMFPKADTLRKIVLHAFMAKVTLMRQNETLQSDYERLRPLLQVDSTFLISEKIFYLQQLNKQANGLPDELCDSLLASFITLQKQYESKIGLQKLKSIDPIYDTHTNNYLYNLAVYASKFNKENLVALLLRNYIAGYYTDSAFKQMKMSDKWQALFSRIEMENSAMLLFTALPIAEKSLQQEKWFLPFKRKTLDESFSKLNSCKDRKALPQLIQYTLSQYPKDASIRSKAAEAYHYIINEFIDSALFGYAQLSIRQHEQELGDSKALLNLKRKLCIYDYKANYFGSRLLRDTVGKKVLSEFEWDGNELLCAAGAVPDHVHAKVEQRINYFRRGAGVPDYVFLDKQKNRFCQDAALVYHANRNKQFVTPAETWKCFSYTSILPARLSARVLGQHTVFAVSSIMSDNGATNTGVGNRRWLLYPPSKSMGHGSTSNVGIIWTLDNSGIRDTAEYMQRFISWPPKDYCPLLFAFERWHFSLYADLSKAKVSLKVNGKEQTIQQEALVSGYGMPSLVWKPLNMKLKENDICEVLIENILRYGETKPQTYRYSVTFIDPMKE